MRRVFFTAIAILAVAVPSFAQNHPLPASVDEALAICTGCPETNASGQNNDGLPTWPYDEPLADHTGRLVDSSNVKGVQHFGFRTARSGLVRTAYSRRGTAPPRVYAKIGEAVGAYALDTFFSSKLPAGMKRISAIDTGSTIGGRGESGLEKITVFDAFLYPETVGSKWVVPLIDGTERLFDFDFDDRGYIYAAYTVFGWGIVTDTGQSNGAHMSKVVQVIDSPDADVRDTSNITARQIFVMKSGSKYYVAVSDPNEMDKVAIWEVTTPSAPVLRDVRTDPPKRWAKDYDRDVLAIVGKDRSLKIYQPAADYATGGSPAAQYSPASGKFFADVEIDDKGRVWTVEAGTSPAPAQLTMVEPNGSGGWSKKVFSAFPYNFEAGFIGAWGGWVAVQGKSSAFGGEGYDLVLFKMEGDTPVAQDLNGFFYKYYHRSPRDYAEPGSYANSQRGVDIVKSGSKNYLIYQAFGMGDVFELGAAGPSLTARLEDVVSDPNPNSQQTDDGPYPGDKVQFKATMSNGATGDVDWNFGNPEAGTADNEREGSVGAAITHQFSGLNTSAKILATKTVSAELQSDSTLNDSVSVNLLVPTARIALASSGELVTSSGFEVVAGEKFADASDGSVDSHYATWRIDGVDTELEPDDEISVGALGSHTLRFTGSWGKYKPSKSASPYVVALPGTSTTYSYEVVPFLATFRPMTRSGSTITFDAEARYTTDTSILSAGSWTVDWTLKNSSGTTVDSQSTTLSKSTNLPNFDVASSDVTNGSKVILRITVANGGVTSGYETYEIEQTLNVPDPDFEFDDCDNVGDDCEIRAVSLSGASTSAWNLSWTVKLGSVSKGSGTGNPFTNADLDTAGTYTVTVTENVWGVTKSENFVVAGSSCSETPTVANITLKYTGATSGCRQNNTVKCKKGETIQFDVSTFAYTLQDCDKFDWDFGDNNDSTLKNPTHVYGGSATSITASLRVYNTNGSATVTHTIPFEGSTTTTCEQPTSASISWTGSGCSGSQCPEDRSLSFTAKKNGVSLESCDSVTWDFGDGTTSGSKSPSHTYATPGTYTVEMTVSNTKGSKSTTRDITIVQSSGGGDCDGIAPTAANISLTYKGTSSGCAHNNSIQCGRGETVEFVAKFFQYSYKGCETITWDFGDGGTASGLTATHAFGGTSSAFPVTLTVATDEGSAQVNHNVVVTGGSVVPTPILSFTTFPVTVEKGKPVTLTASSNLPATTGWKWSFGDGTSDDSSQATLTQQTSTVTHAFNKTGTLTVKVQARNAADLLQPLTTLQKTISVTAPAPETKFLLPVVSHVGDATAAVKWRTDVQIYNPDTTVSSSNPLVLKVTFGGKEYLLGITRSTQIYEDFLWQLVGATGGCPGDVCAGPAIISTSASQLPQIWSRTYVDTGAGTYGQFIPAIRLDQGGASAGVDGKYYLAGLKVNAEFRTNIGLVNPTATDLPVTIRFYDGRTRIGEVAKTLQPFVFSQFAVVASGQSTASTIVVPGLPTDRPFSVQIEVAADKWIIGYASLIDSRTNDPIFIGAVEDSELASADYGTIVIPGVSHTGQWRTDLTLFNPDAETINVDIAYHDITGAKKAEALAVPVDRVLQVNGILKQGLLGDVPDGSGLLKIKLVTTGTVAHPLAYVRTYFDTITSGTYGQGISGFPTVRANVRQGKPALIPAVRGGANYRTNVFLVNVGETATRVRVSVLDPNSGAVVSTPEYDLAPNQTIPHTNFLTAMGLSALTQATLKVEIAPGSTGSVWAYASVIDQQTSDPEYVQAFPLVP